MKIDSIDQLCVNAVRVLSCECIELAGSGHPGLALGAAPMAYVLWRNHLCHNPEDPNWFNRDRFVLSAGHGSAMFYSLLHLSGFNLTINDLKHFRQLNSKTPGHPEYGTTCGVDATTGPLGQGLGMAVGMAMAEAHLSSMYHTDQTDVINHRTFVLCGDGDLMEGVSHEAASLAGHLKLGKLTVLYDSNEISLDGATGRSYSDNVRGRFESYGWHYECVEDGNDLNEIDAAICRAKEQNSCPTLIEVRTVIGFGAPGQGTNSVHGTPLGDSGIANLRTRLNWHFPEFTIPKEVYQRFADCVAKRGKQAEAEWIRRMNQWSIDFPKQAKQLKQSLSNKPPITWKECLPQYAAGTEASGREISHHMIQILAEKIPYLWGGSADLASSNKTDIENSDLFSAANRDGRNIAFGVREFAEGALLNGMMLHGGSRVFGGTFLVFSDYMRGAIRLSALQKLPVIYIFTHDSIAVGEDGPTHEPVEHLMSLRTMPGISLIRPADANETVAAWEAAMDTLDRPTVLALSRQQLPVLRHSAERAREGVRRGGYVLSPQTGASPEAIFIATGSEVRLAVAAQQLLKQTGHDVSVVSLPCFDRFEHQSEAYRESVLPSCVRRRVSIEMGATLGWERYVGAEGIRIGVDTFGSSGPATELLQTYGFTENHIVDQYLQLIDSVSPSV
ncbi:transketolase [Sporolactobacillus nakayamae]|uniref:Transketolase n=1 Tax=Sporolactobacillus nakayamae TaxID=269670 RepID=A0A1I2NYG3_9BACL|nr:transketolase [Sporolactobacillus nakayamae]SFG09005.1 transketolase [Sporolactobacillus nakayamae]